MVKIAFWDQKSSFFQSHFKWSYGRYMAGNMLLGCPGHILRAFLISGSDLVHFWKNRKKNGFFDWFFAIYAHISRHKVTRGGGWNVFPCFWPHFALNRAFLSRQEVPGCHKNIYRELRPSFIRSEIFGNICCCFRQQKQHSVLTLHVDISLWPYPK